MPDLSCSSCMYSTGTVTLYEGRLSQHWFDLIRLVEFSNICCDDGSLLLFWVLSLPAPSLSLSLPLCPIWSSFLPHNLRKLFFFVIAPLVLSFIVAQPRPKCCCCRCILLIGSHSQTRSEPISSHIMTHGIYRYIASSCCCCRLRKLFAIL